jgi:Helix-turn-helix domain
VRQRAGLTGETCHTAAKPGADKVSGGPLLVAPESADSTDACLSEGSTAERRTRTLPDKFYPIPAWICDLGLSPAAMIVFAYLLFRQVVAAGVWAQQSYTAKETGLPLRTVQRAIAELKQRRLLRLGTKHGFRTFELADPTACLTNVLRKSETPSWR